jgi:hypothetical protein
MRVRPIFWILLVSTCMGVLLLAMVYQPHIPVRLQVHMVQTQLVANRPASLNLEITDPEGTPINQAQVIPSAHMTNMVMQATDTSVHKLGNGRYRVNINLYMSGPWAITIQTNITGFTSQERTFLVNVT